MVTPLHYFLALLCVKLTFCGPVKMNLDDAFEKGVNPDCKSFPIPSSNSTFFADCEYPVPDIDLKNEKSVSRTLKFKLNEIICYSAVSNMMSLCPAGQEELAKGKELNVDIDSDKVDTFCEDLNSLSVQHDCERMSEQDKSDCDLLKKVVSRLSTSEQCKEHCIVDGELFMGCQYLYASTRAVSKVLGEGVVQKSTQKTVVGPLDIPKPPVGASSSKSPINESQAKDDANLSSEGKKDDEEKAGEIKGAEADKQTQPEEANKPEDSKKDSTPQKTEETKPDSDKGGGKNVLPGSDQDFLPLSEDYLNQYSDQKVIHNRPIVENTMQADKSRSPDDASSSFFSYFILLSIVAIVAYLVFHNKQKILALILEGRRRQGSRRRSGGREYRKLDSNLEDTMNSENYTSGQHVIY